jgi:hypothetical protein
MRGIWKHERNSGGKGNPGDRMNPVDRENPGDIRGILRTGGILERKRNPGGMGT